MVPPLLTSTELCIERLEAALALKGQILNLAHSHLLAAISSPDVALARLLKAVRSQSRLRYSNYHYPASIGFRGHSYNAKPWELRLDGVSGLEP
jgi:hypothetical protein